MKKYALWAVCALIMTACGGKKQPVSSSENDTASEEEIVEVVEPVHQTSYLTKDSIGPIAVGMNMYRLPDSIDGLYSHREQGASMDAVTMTFSDSNGEQFVAYDFGEGNIDLINVVGNDVHVKSPNGDLGIGTSFRQVLALPGVTTEWASHDTGGMWYWCWEGLWFAPSQDGLTAPLVGRLYHSEEAPEDGDFDENVRIGFIGTGLPF